MNHSAWTDQDLLAHYRDGVSLNNIAFWSGREMADIKRVLKIPENDNLGVSVEEPKQEPIRIES